MQFPSPTSLGIVSVAAAMLIPMWSQAKQLFAYLRSFLIVSISIEGEASFFLTAYLEQNCSLGNFGDKNFISDSVFVKSKGKNEIVVFHYPKNKIYRKGWFLIFMSRKHDKQQGNSVIEITSIRGCNLSKLLLTAVACGNSINSVSNRFKIVYKSGKVHTYNGASGRDQDSDIESPVRDSRGSILVPLGMDISDIGDNLPIEEAFMGLSFPVEVEDALHEFDYWLQSKDWFEKRCVPWRRGWLLSGPPGTGKSRLTRAIAIHGNMPLFVFDIGTMTNQEFQNEWQYMLSSTPCLALIEDIDAVFEGRKNISGHENSLTFDCLLNTISGVSQSNGVFLVITTNNPDKVDPAIGVVENNISSRPGRIDRIINVGVLPDYCRREIAERILDEWPEHIAEVVTNTEGYTGAQVTDVCVTMASKLFWEKNDGQTLSS